MIFKFLNLIDKLTIDEAIKIEMNISLYEIPM